jgi:hypothetical protein
MGLILFSVSYNKEINSTAAFLNSKTEHRKRMGRGEGGGGMAEQKRSIRNIRQINLSRLPSPIHQLQQSLI